MTFQTRQIKGKGRGKLLGFPTINMEIPSDMDLAEGIYAVWVIFKDKRFVGALHYGPVPTFQESKKSLEVFLLDVTETEVKSLDTFSIQISPIARVRDVRTFSSKEGLIEQMRRDIDVIRRSAFPVSEE